MNSKSQIHCRLCAELKPSEKLFDLMNDASKCIDIFDKLSYVNAIYVDLSDETIPKTICFVCCDQLEKAYDFLYKVQKAQTVIRNIYCKVDLNSDNSCDERDSRISPEPESLIVEKNDLSNVKNSSKDTSLSQLNIKNEPKEENEIIPRSELLSTETVNLPSKNVNQNLDVQEILNAAIFDNNIECSSEHIMWYGKEISNDGNLWKDYTWLCSHCKMEFGDLYVLRLHSKEVHKKCCAFACADCFVKADNFKDFIDHVRKHRKNLRHCCPYCDLITESSSATNKHLSEHFPNRECACKLCGEIFIDSDALEKHTLQYTIPKTARKPRRKRGTPITTEDLTCKLCNKVYKNLNSLRDHSKLHTSDRKRNYTCDRCGKAFFQKGTLMSHIMAHEKVKPHVCKICNKSFLFPNMLRRHVEMHTGIKPYSCEQCGRCFRLLYQLKAHKIIHTDRMPYSCQYCNKLFRFKQIMKNHELQHTGAKPYICQICPMEFTNWSNYNKHMKRRHGTDTSKKKITPEGVIPVNPETGQLVEIKDSIETEEWRSKIMIPCKRGKKKIIKQENVNS